MGLLGRYWSGSVAWGVSLLGYLITLCPTVYVEGSGELIGATYLLGTPHPTGYPLFCLGGRLCAVLLPFTDPAGAINLFSAFCGSLAVGALSALLQERGLHPLVALGVGLGFGFSSTFWSQVVIAEVYGLGLLGAVLLLWAGVRAVEGGSERDWLCLAYAAGTGLTLHLSLVLIWPGVGLLILLRQVQFIKVKALLAKGLLLFVLGLSPILYLLIRNGEGAGFHWGVMISMGQWWDHLSGALYRDSFFSMPASAMLLNMRRWGVQMLGEFHLLLVPLLLWGGWAGYRRDRVLWWLATAAGGCNLLVALNYHRDPNGLGVFFLISILVLAFFLGWGMEDLIGRWGLGSKGSAFAGLTVAAVICSTHYTAADRHLNRIAHQYGSEILQGLPQGAVLIAEGDDAAFILDYLQRLEGQRPDVTLYNRMGRGRDILKREELGLDPAQQFRLRLEHEAQLIARCEGPVFYLYARRLAVEGYRLVPAGLCYRVWPAGEPVPPEVIGPEPDMDKARDPGWYRDPWVRKIQSNYAFMRGEHLMARRDTSSALEAYRESARIAYDSRTARFNIALMMLRNNRLEEAWQQGQAALELDPWNPEVYSLLAQVRGRQGYGLEAEALFKKAGQLGRKP